MGGFVWYDLLTTDVEAAIRFYGEVVGWTTVPFESSDPAARSPRPPYRMWKPPVAGPIGGVEAMSDDLRRAGRPPAWLGYAHTVDLDRTLADAKARGARVVDGPHHLPGVGKMATLLDPGGATFAAFEPEGSPPTDERPGVRVGQVAWVELFAADLEEAWAFYSELFGWTRTDSMEMGPAGEYRMFTTDGTQGGGMMTKPAQVPRPSWGFYFRVQDLDRAVATAQARGGRLLNGPMEVPGGDRIAQLVDPQGAAFAVHVPKA
jgi:hypothetical protein